MSAKGPGRLPPLTPTGTARALFLGEEDDLTLPPELRATLRAHDVSDQLLWAAWEATGWVAAAPLAERQALACLLVGLLVTIDGGGTCLPLGPPAAPGASREALPRAAAGDFLAASLNRLGVPAAERKAAVALAARLNGGAAPPGLAALFDHVSAPSSRESDGARGDNPGRRPFVVAAGALYPERLWALEGRLVTLLRRRMSAAAPPLAAAASIEEARRALDAAPGAVSLSDEQGAAIRAALTQPLTLIAGGPGTGKTATVVALLRVLARLGVRAGQIALAAPTGRAAQRMKESVDTALSRLQAAALPAHVVSAADEELARDFAGATTLHRLLGIRPTPQRALEPEVPLFYADWPLPQRVVIVDEASMIDLVLMEQLCAALAPGTRLVLIGDVDQLPSVQVGAVFRDLVTGAPAVVRRLTRSHRMNPADPAGAAILHLAGAVNAGTVDAATLAPRASAAGLAFAGCEGLASQELYGFLDRWHRDILAAETNLELALDRRYRLRLDDAGAPSGAQSGTDVRGAGDGDGDRDDAAAIKTLLDTLQAARILCVTRTAGRTSSAAAINALMHARVQAAALARGADLATVAAPFIPGEPVLVLRNDHTRGLANGDLGVVLRIRAARGDTLGVAFARGDTFVVHALDSIRTELSLAFALTVHKAQGSEYERVALVLPEDDVPLLTREVLYTALTRARRSVVVVGNAALFAAAATRTLERTSGIVPGLWER